MEYDERIDGYHVVIRRGSMLHHTSYSHADKLSIIRRILMNWGAYETVSRISMTPKVTRIAKEADIITLKGGVKMNMSTGKLVPGGGSRG